MISDFAGGDGGDVIHAASADNLALLATDDAINELEIVGNYMIRGDYESDTNVFAQGNGGIDALILLNAQHSMFGSSDNFVFWSDAKSMSKYYKVQAYLWLLLIL